VGEVCLSEAAGVFRGLQLQKIEKQNLKRRERFASSKHALYRNRKKKKRKVKPGKP